MAHEQGAARARQRHGAVPAPLHQAEPRRAAVGPPPKSPPRRSGERGRSTSPRRRRPGMAATHPGNHSIRLQLLLSAARVAPVIRVKKVATVSDPILAKVDHTSRPRGRGESMRTNTCRQSTCKYTRIISRTKAAIQSGGREYRVVCRARARPKAHERRAGRWFDGPQTPRSRSWERF